ncbi:Asp23/Gls24 family envelope stress response protein [Carnobacterium divergens]|uniref:Stress response regulator gls24 homolog n=2 Tax=Carnobacterium divergens TaxID=2748 RepID=A0A2R7ZY87_CARDV|nr:Asp23/Gls24 family envelope stress response protein [Carnobacterium divergens]TFI65182.1 Asp23/Gls24 family envelope stress response protein [Carnobacterium divergens]TFI75482.1 Asp23/Gls24 family envelope stress response protein [Carnobacterium divergens]TFI76548.1 Asp23/Gls24 family envelope stress response protein [Carnobacterium divergens]TFI80093.1 Asp23/Gls24 family envelope stress response protein [Carnobacterium divergens]
MTMTELTKQDNKKGNAQTITKELTYEDKVLQKIIGISLEEVEGLLTLDGGFFSNLAEKFVNTDSTTSGVNVEVGKKQIAVDLDIVVEYGRNIPELFDEIVTTIQANVQSMTGLNLVEVNVKVVDVKSKEQHEQESVTVQDRVSDFTEKAGNSIGEQTEKVKKIASKTTVNAKEKMDSSRVE